MGAVGKRHYRYRPDGLAHESSQTAHQVVSFTRDKEARLETPHTLTAEGSIFHVDPLLYPFGITLVKVSITLKEDAAYEVVVEEWSGEPATADNDVATITTTGFDAYMAVLADAMDDTVIASGAYLYLHLPNTVVPYLHFKFIFNVNSS